AAGICLPGPVTPCSCGKKSAAQGSRAKSTPKEEGGGDMGSSLEVLDQLDCKVIALKELWIILGWNSSIFCALRHFFARMA
ncbi:hypothetical protein, partial [Candidatus Accumulibacter vicinus]